MPVEHTQEQQMINWSQQNYQTLTKKQHQANNEWFKSMVYFTKPGGVIYIPNLGKGFTTDGKKV